MNRRIISGTLALEDGKIFHGVSVGAEGLATGEIVFNTSMTGYQEVLTDPSYSGQIVAMTAPQIGNTGINEEDDESEKPRLKGFVMREYSAHMSSWRATESLESYLFRNHIVALSEIDTRTLTRHIRSSGAMRAVIATGKRDVDALVDAAKNASRLEECDYVDDVTTRRSYSWREACPWSIQHHETPKTVIVYDFGVKRGILRCLASCGVKVTVVPANASAESVMAAHPDWVYLSNGPGDPLRLGAIVEEIKKLIGRIPVVGICLGHQIIALALGASTYKLKFGHHGINQPVLNHETGRVEITSQNHGFCVARESVPEEVTVTHTHLNDGTVEGIRHKYLPVFSVQFHPEAAAGPHDSADFFQKR